MVPVFSRSVDCKPVRLGKTHLSVLFFVRSFVVAHKTLCLSIKVWKTYRAIPGTGKLVFKAWHESCSQYEDQLDLMEQCAGNAGVFRPTFLSAFYFFANAIATRIVPTLNKEAWPAKYALFFFGLLVSMFIPSYPRKCFCIVVF